MPDVTPELPAAPLLTRRTVVAGAGAAAAGITLLAAGCSAGGSNGGAAPPAAPAAAGTVLGPSSDVPVGGGKIYADAKVVVTQATAGSFAGFSSTCTHQGCQVSKVEGGLILCPCHGSAYALDGTVKRGPAPKSLPTQSVTVTGGQITTA